MGAGVSVREGALARSGVLPAHLQRTAGAIHGAEPMAFDDEIASWEQGLKKQSQTPFKDWPAHDAAVEGAIREWESSLNGEQAELERTAFAKAASPPTPATPGTGLKAAKRSPAAAAQVSAPRGPRRSLPRAMFPPSRDALRARHVTAWCLSLSLASRARRHRATQRGQRRRTPQRRRCGKERSGRGNERRRRP